MIEIGIYKITSPTNRIYIGQSWNLEQREKDYKRMHCYGQHKIYNSLKKYGWNKHNFEIVHILPENITQEVLDNYEISCWKEYKNLGFDMMNIKEPGSRGKNSEESKKKMSESRKKLYLSEEYSLRASKIARERNNLEGLKEYCKIPKFGSNNPVSVISEETAKLIKIDLLTGSTSKFLSIKYNISTGVIDGIRYNKAWQHVIVDGWDKFKVKSRVKLEDSIVIEIKNYLTEGLTAKEICSKMNGISEATIYNVAHDRTRKEVIVDNWKNNSLVRSGSKSYHAKLNEDQVREIKKLLSEGKRSREISKIYSIGESALSSLKSGKTWKHVTI